MSDGTAEGVSLNRVETDNTCNEELSSETAAFSFCITLSSIYLPLLAGAHGERAQKSKCRR